MWSDQELKLLQQTSFKHYEDIAHDEHVGGLVYEKKLVVQARISHALLATVRGEHEIKRSMMRKLAEDFLAEWYGFSNNFYDRLENGGMEVE